MVEPVGHTTPIALTRSDPMGKPNEKFVRKLAIAISLSRAIDDVLQSLKKTKHLFRQQQS